MTEKDKLLISTALESGAVKAAIIEKDNIIVSESFRAICASNQCGLYGQCWMCPPDIGEIGLLMEQVKQYPYGLLYQTITEIEDSFDIEGMLEAGRLHARASRQLQKELGSILKGDFLHLGSGGCRFCETCAKTENKPCRFPEAAMASMEGYGIDVYQTTRKTDLKYINGQNTVTYFGIVLFSE